MVLRYLFGPVTTAYADQNLRGLRDAVNCLAFGPEGPDVTVGLGDSWAAMEAKLPAGWRPDFVALHLADQTVPASLWTAPVPLIALAVNWRSSWTSYRRRLRCCDFVVADSVGAELLAQEGVSHVVAGSLFGLARDFVEHPWPDRERDIDVLFAGDLRPAAGEKLDWLNRLAKLGQRRRVLISASLQGDEYRGLLSRVRIVFVPGARGEAQRQALEAVAAGALLVQEACSEASAPFKDRLECVLVTEDDFDDLLDGYLDDEAERRGLAETARKRIGEFTFERLWENCLQVIECNWAAIVERSGRRPTLRGREELLTRTAEAVGGYRSIDPHLVQDLASALAAAPKESTLHNALGLAATVAAMGNGPLEAALARQAVGYFQRATKCDPSDVVAGMNVAKALMDMEDVAAAIEQARRTLAIAERLELLPAHLLDAGRFPPVPDAFHAAWERAGWENAGHPKAEARAKLDLVRWRLHSVLGVLSNDAEHAHEAAVIRPDLVASQANLGWVLRRAGKSAEAVPHFRRALAADPLDWGTVDELFQALEESSDGVGQRRLADERRLLAAVAPNLLPQREWIAKIPPPGDELVSIIILCCNEAAYTRRCLESVFKHSRRPFEVILVDNGSSDETAALLEEVVGQVSTPAKGAGGLGNPPHNGTPHSGTLGNVAHNGTLGNVAHNGTLGNVAHNGTFSNVPHNGTLGNVAHDGTFSNVPHRVPERVVVVRNETNRGYAAGCNQGLAKARGRYLVFLNNDTVVTPHWLEGLIGWSLVDWPQIGMVGPVSNYAPAPQHVPVTLLDLSFLEGFAAGRRREFAGKAIETERLTGFCLLVRREVVQQIGGFDEGYGLGFFEDDDLCVRAREAGYRLLVAPEVFIHHFGSRTVAGLGLDAEKQLTANFARFKEKWGEERTARYRLVASDESAVASEVVDSGQGSVGTEVVASDQWSVASEEGPKGRVPAECSRSPNSALTTNHYALTTVSLCMIVKNEEGNLADCLGSVADLVDEIVIVDTGSTDQTREVARKLGAKVFEFPWVDSFAAARNESLKHAGGQWVFWMDADDRLDNDNRGKLQSLFASLNGENVAYSMKCLCPPESHDGPSTVVDHVRLFRSHPDIRWKYRVHEQILPAVRQAGGEIRAAGVVIHHLGYVDRALRKRKHERDLRLLALDLEENPDDPFVHFNLGWNLEESGKLEEALPYLRKSLQASQPTDSIVYKLYTLMTQCQRKLGRLDEALAVCLEGRALYPDDAELLFSEASLRQTQRDLNGAESCLVRLLQGAEEPQFASVATDLRGYKAQHLLAVVYRDQGRTFEAEALWRQVAGQQPAFAPAWLGLAELKLRQGQLAEVETFIEKSKATGAVQGSGAVVMEARLLLARKEFVAARQLLETALAEQDQDVLLWTLLSHVLLQEGKDLEAAERVLRKVLELNPGDAEAGNNLQVLLRQQGREDAPTTAAQQSTIGALPST